MATLQQKINALIERFIPIIKDAFIAAIRDVTNRAILNDLIRAIEGGDLEAAFRALGFSEAAMRPVTAAIVTAFETGGVTVAGTFPKRLNTPTGRTVFRFNVRDSRAEAWLRDESASLVTRLSEGERTNIRNVVTEGMRDGRNPRNVALDIIGRVNVQTGKREGGIVGLTVPFERAVSRSRIELRALDSAYFRRERRDKRFDGTVRKAIESGVPLTYDQITKISGRYSDSLLQLRGENIARTETIAALNRSEWETVKQAAATGAIDASATQRIWDNAGDKRVRHSHDEMEGQSVGIDEPFKTPDGALLMYPGDTSLDAPANETINCRCRARLKINWLKGLK